MTRKRNHRFTCNIQKFLAVNALALVSLATKGAAAPDAAVRETTSEASLAIVGSDNAQALRRNAASNVAPHLDFQLGKQPAAEYLWSQATPEPKERPTRNFEQLPVRIRTRSLATASTPDGVIVTAWPGSTGRAKLSMASQKTSASPAIAANDSILGPPVDSIA